jgi:hypothetical protein
LKSVKRAVANLDAREFVCFNVNVTECQVMSSLNLLNWETFNKDYMTAAGSSQGSSQALPFPPCGPFCFDDLCMGQDSASATLQLLIAN